MDLTSQSKNKTAQVLLILACFVIIVAGMKAAESLVVPFFLAAFITIIASPPFIWLQKKKVPKVLALVLVILIFLSFIFLVGVLIGTSVSEFSSNISSYEQKLKNQTEGIIQWLAAHNYIESDFDIFKIINPSSVLQFIGDSLNQISGMFADGFLILFTVIFMLLEVSGLPKKIRLIVSKPEESIARINSVYQKINKYMGIKTLLSFGTGFLVYIFLLIVGLDYPLLWAVLASILYYIPTIGSMIALIPPVLLAIIQLGFGQALIVMVGFVIINTIIGNILEPKFMGRGLELSTLVVFLSLVFWGWILGPIGMLLSVPLTITLKIALESSEETRWIAVMLGPDSSE